MFDGMRCDDFASGIGVADVYVVVVVLRLV